MQMDFLVLAATDVSTGKRLQQKGPEIAEGPGMFFGAQMVQEDSNLGANLSTSSNSLFPQPHAFF